MTEKIQRVTNHPGLIKTGGAVINTDNSEYQKARARLNMTKKNKKLEERVAMLETNIARLIGMIEGNKNG